MKHPLTSGRFCIRVKYVVTSQGQRMVTALEINSFQSRTLHNFFKHSINQADLGVMRLCQFTGGHGTMSKGWPALPSLFAKY